LAFHQERRDLPLLLHPQVSCDSPASARYHDSSPEESSQSYSSHAPNRPRSHPRPTAAPAPAPPPICPKPQPLHWTGQQRLRGFEESNVCGKLRVQLKRHLIHPLGMNRKRERLPERPKYMDIQTTNLCSNSLNAPQQLVAKLHLLAWQRFEPDEKVSEQAATSMPAL